MPYSKFDANEMIMRDFLAYDRTILANERTLLSYFRTTIAFLAAGVTLIKLFPQSQCAQISGVSVCGIACFTFIFGIYSFIKMGRRLARVRNREQGMNHNKE